MASVRVLRPGLLTTVQDGGRWGLQSHGVPPAGPMDPWSHRMANALVGNGADAATLEVTLKGPELEFDDERIVAVAGAHFAIDVDSQGQSPNTAFIVPAGARLRVGVRRIGARGCTHCGRWTGSTPSSPLRCCMRSKMRRGMCACRR